MFEPPKGKNGKKAHTKDSVEKMTAKLIEENKLDPNRVYIRIKLGEDANGNDLDEVVLWSFLVEQQFEWMISGFFSLVKRSQLGTAGQKYAYDELQRIMKDTSLLQKFQPVIESAPQRMARKKAESDSQEVDMMEKAGGENDLESPDLGMDENLFDTQGTYQSILMEENIHEGDTDLKDVDSSDDEEDD